MLQKVYQARIVKTEPYQTNPTIGIALLLLLLTGCGGATSPSPNGKGLVTPKVEAPGVTQKETQQDQNRNSMETMQRQMDIQMMPKDMKK